MIYIADSERNITPELDSLSKGNPFGCRIKSLYNTYDFNLPFVDFWVQIIGSECVSLLARLETTIILQLTEKSDMDEISAFVRVSGAEYVIADGKYTIDCGMKRTEGPILMCSESFELGEGLNIVEPTVREVYDIISKCRSDSFAVPEYESFALDAGHKLGKGQIRMLGVEDVTLAACIMTLAETEDSAVLGALATDPGFRNLGYGAYLIKYINNVLVGEGKTVFLHRAPGENIEFYNKLGFSEYGIWAEYR